MRGLSLAAEGEPEQLRGLAVTPSFFTHACSGSRSSAARSSRRRRSPGADKFAILTYNLWNSRFAADRSIVGRDVRLGGEPYQVVGVLPADFELPGRDIALLVPFAFTPQQMSDQGARQRVQPDDRAAQAGRDDRAGQRADEDHRRPQPGAPARSGRRLRERAASAATPCRSAISSSAISGRRSTSSRPACCSCCSSPARTSPTCC